jgi:hypothetical protein
MTIFLRKTTQSGSNHSAQELFHIAHIPFVHANRVGVFHHEALADQLDHNRLQSRNKINLQTCLYYNQAKMLISFKFSLDVSR